MLTREYGEKNNVTYLLGMRHLIYRYGHVIPCLRMLTREYGEKNNVTYQFVMLPLIYRYGHVLPCTIYFRGIDTSHRKPFT
jgi:hypothetical protein